MIKRIAIALSLLLLVSCNAGNVKNDIQNGIDLVNGVPRKTIDTTRLGTNAFVNDPQFGSVRAQLSEVKNTLRLNFVRVLFAWSDAVQPSPSDSPNFSFYDDIVSAIPDGMDALVLITGVPGWMSDSRNWIDGNPRRTFVELWARQVMRRYSSNPKIVGWEIWNEPNMVANPENSTLGIATDAANYVEMLALAHDVSRELNPGKLVLNGATTSINQNFSETLDYNRAMRDAGAQNFVDRWAIHFYGKEFENVVRSHGVADFLNGLGVPVWVTESGAQGVNDQLAYGEQVWPFLIDNIPSIQRIYQYQFAEATPSATTYGLRNPDPAFPVSDLYVFLRDR